MISNWTKHIKNCFDNTQKQKKHGRQVSLTMFISQPNSVNNNGSGLAADLDHGKCSESSKQDFWKPPPV